MLEKQQLVGIISKYNGYISLTEGYGYIIPKNELDGVLRGIQDLEMQSAEKIAKLEAKVFAYEQIISNSNFKAVVEREEEC